MSVHVEKEQVKKFRYYLKVTFSKDVVLIKLTRGLKQHEASGINKEELLVSRDLQDISRMGVYNAMVVSTVLFGHDS